MEILKHTRLLTVFLVTCFCLKQVLASRNITGRCCGVTSKASSSDNSGRDCPGAALGTFQPPVINMQHDEAMNISWKTHTLQCPPAYDVVYHNISDDINVLLLSQDGMFLEFEYLSGFLRSTREYCVEKRDGNYLAAICQRNSEKLKCGSGVCIPKCCGEGEILEDITCKRGTWNMSIQFYGIYGQPVTAPSDMVMLGDMVPDCGGVKFQGYKNGMLYHLLVNGELLIPESGLTFGMDQYCMEDRYQNGKHLPLFLICQGGNTVMKVKNRLQIFGDMVTIIFLTVTTVFHILIPSLRDTQDLCFISHIVAMGVAYIFLLIFSLSLHAISKGFCIVGGIIFNYSFLAMFFWLNIMCFDIWRVIRQTTRGIPLIGILSNGTKKFRLYCLFGWGVPLVVTAVASIIYLLPEEHTKNLTVPRFGQDICWLTGEMELLVYCYSFVGALFILDLILIGHTMVMLFQAGNAFMYFSKQVSGNAFNRKYIEAFWQRFSLFVLMVLCWTTDLLSWKIPPKEIWLVTDIINSLQGFLVFIIFISNAKRRGMVRDLFKKAPLPCFKATPLTSN